MFVSRPLKTGFTLVELLVVIVVIGILMGLLLAALGPALFTSYNFAVTSEIRELEGAIDKFKTKFGFYPPSEFDFDGDTIRDLTPGTGDPQDVATFKQYLRRIAPNHEETDAAIGQWWAEVGSNLDNDSVLVFWLSGLNASAQFPLTSYGQDMQYGTGDDTPGNAFNGKNTTEEGYLSPPYVPPEKIIFFEFTASQYQDVALKVKRYLQRRIGGQPYVYFDSRYYANSAGVPFPCLVTDIDSAGVPTPHDIYAYRELPTNQSPPKYYNPTTFQIIAAGRDRIFGLVNAPNYDWTIKNPPTLENFIYQRDNISNFAGGILERLTQ